MKLSKKLTAIFTPIASISIVAPIATSCGGKTFKIEFGDSVNCAFSKDKEHTKIAKYHTKKQVYAAVQNIANIAGKITITKDLANQNRDMQNVYADFIASLCMFEETTKFFLECKLNDDSTEFETFNLFYNDDDEKSKSGDESIFVYEKEGDKLHITFEGLSFPSYIYQEATVTG